uniref:Aminopeptidase n=1 Tax=Ditylenchus dipsaci TaxID=166011 RepID=A0A915CXF3_9BILA
MDMISVPRFSAGAMENWGLVTFRESAMLYTEASGVSAKHWVAEWFGDLVTLNWWDDLFLNEGFATLFSSLGAVQSVKDYDIEGSFLYNMQNAFAYDSDKNAPPLSPHSGFDGIAYDKGASILRMIEMVMGPENFIHGIRRYLNKHQFTNTKHSQLLEALHAGIPPSENNILASPPKGSPLSIVDFGKAWIETPGHPLVSVTRLDSSRVKLTQKRFFNDGQIPSNASTWPIPIWHSVNNVTQKLTWLHDVLVLENIKESDLLTINEKSHGYYRVKYRGDLMQKIRQRLLTKHSDFSPLARARIIDDAFALANADRLNYDSALNLVFYEEDHKLPKALVHKHLISILDHFDESDDPKTAQYIRQLSKGFSGGNDREFVFRAPHTEANRICLLTNGNLKSEFKKHLLDPCQKSPEKMSSQCNTLPDPDHVSLYCDGIKYAREVEFDYIFELFKKENNPDERKALLESLTCTENKDKIRHLLDVASDTKNPLLKLNERGLIFDKFSKSNSAAKAIYFDYMKDNWQTLYSGFKNNKIFLKELVRSVLANYPSTASIKQLEEFVEKNVHKSKPLRSTFDEAITSLKAKRQWIKRILSQLLTGLLQKLNLWL